MGLSPGARGSLHTPLTYGRQSFIPTAGEKSRLERFARASGGNKPRRSPTHAITNHSRGLVCGTRGQRADQRAPRRRGLARCLSGPEGCIFPGLLGEGHPSVPPCPCVRGAPLDRPMRTADCQPLPEESAGAPESLVFVVPRRDASSKAASGTAIRWPAAPAVRRLGKLCHGRGSGPRRGGIAAAVATPALWLVSMLPWKGIPPASLSASATTGARTSFLAFAAAIGRFAPRRED